MVEYLLCMQRGVGSIPIVSIKLKRYYFFIIGFLKILKFFYLSINMSIKNKI